VNAESGAVLHRFQWLEDEDISEVPETWNWLDGWSRPPADGLPPKVVHYTRGGPWFDNWQDVAYAAEWIAEEKAFQDEGGEEIWNILDFWFEEIDPVRWFDSDAAFDRQMRARFGESHARAARGELAAWRKTPWGALAEIILLDQFSRNLYRGDARAFACDLRALEAHRQAMARGFDHCLIPNQRQFLYMPLQHSESHDVQAEAVVHFAALGDPDSYSFALRHQEIINRFGRFPHRNDVLGRETTSDESMFLRQPNSTF
jgi:uncharacterized protein (DUF924 family)